MTVIADVVTVVSGAVYIPVTKMPIMVVMAGANTDAIRADDYGVRHSRCYKYADTQASIDSARSFFMWCPFGISM